MKQVVKLLLVVVGVLLIASWAKAQETDLAKPWGASITVGEQYTDNRDGVKTNKNANADLYIQPRADFYWRDGERTTLDLFMSPLAKMHSNPRRASDGDPQHATDLFGSGGIDLTHQLDPRLDLRLSDLLSYNDDPAIDVGGTSVRQNSSVLLNGAVADVRATVTPLLGLEYIGHDSIKRYKDKTVAANNDENSLDSEVNAGYLFGDGYKVFGLGAMQSFDSKSTTRDRGANVYEGGVGFERYISADVHARVSGGYQYAEYKDTTLGNVDMPNGKIDVVYRPQSPTRCRASVVYGFYAPYVPPYSVQKLLGAQVAIDHDLLPQRLMLTLRGQYSDGKYDAEGASAPGGSDKMSSVGADVTYRMNHNWGLSLGYTFEDWNSDIRQAFEQNIIDMSIKASF